MLLAQVSGFPLPALRREPFADATRFSRTAVVCRASQCREPLLYVPRSLLRTTAVQCTEPYVPYVPSRKPYVPSWSQGGSSKKNVYQEQQTEYEEYAKALQGRADESEDSPLAPPSLEAIEGALRAALAPVRLQCGEQDPFGRPSPPASPRQASWPRRADPRSCLRCSVGRTW